jgi:hypothetical protein
MRRYSSVYYRTITLARISKGEINHVEFAYDAVKLDHPDVIDDIEEICPGTYQQVYEKAVEDGDQHVIGEMQYLVRRDSK